MTQFKTLIKKLSATNASALVIYSVLAMVLLAFQNCSDVHFSSLSSKSAAVQGGDTTQGGGDPNPTCTTVIQNTTSNLRIIFMVDNSSSTVSGLSGATDPNYYYRKTTIEQFLAQYGTKTNFTYAFGQFSDNSAAFYDTQKSVFSWSFTSPFGTAANLQTALDYYLSASNAGGNTPYQSAFNAISSIISSDSASDMATPPNYAVIFMSDGKPNPDMTNSQLLTVVDAVLNAASSAGRMATVSTVYFGPENTSLDLQAKQNLVNMAAEGKGQFYDTNHPTAGGLIENVLTIPGSTQVCTQGI